MSDLISRQTAIDAVQGIGRLATLQDNDAVVRMSAVEYVLFNLPSAQPVLDRAKISDLMEKIYSIQSPHLSTEGVIAKKYYCEQLWIELFGSEDVPKWID